MSVALPRFNISLPDYPASPLGTLICKLYNTGNRELAEKLEGQNNLTDILKFGVLSKADLIRLIGVVISMNNIILAHLFLDERETLLSLGVPEKVLTRLAAHFCPTEAPEVVRDCIETRTSLLLVISSSQTNPPRPPRREQYQPVESQAVPRPSKVAGGPAGYSHRSPFFDGTARVSYPSGSGKSRKRK